MDRSPSTPLATAVPFFIVGCPRSGTTLLRRLLVAHPRISIPEESHFIPLMHRAYGDPATEVEARRLADAILSLRWIRDWKCPIDRDRLAECRSFAALVATLFESHARREGKPRWGDKTPQYVTCIPLLAGLFPDARFIHIHRDPRDVVPSWIAAPFGPTNHFVAAAAWDRLVTTGRAAGRLVPPGAYLEIGYEMLVRDVEGTMRAVCGFLGEEFHPAVLTPAAFTGRLQTPRFFGRARSFEPTAMDGQPVEPANVGKWRTGLEDRDRAIIEAAAAPGMKAFGYPLAGPVRHVGAVEHAWYRLHGFVTENVTRINMYPVEDVVATARELVRAKWRCRRRSDLRWNHERNA